MSKEYWQGRWERGETGWHQDEVEPRLVEGFSGLKPTRVLVPLCGKSLDLTWLASQGHEVIGVEWSEQACRAFFDENRIAYASKQEGPFRIFEGGRIKILNGDFFETTPESVGALGAIYDRAALIALPPELRKRYSRHIRELIRSCASKSGFRFLQLVLFRADDTGKGPPYSVSEEELRELYGNDFEVTVTSREEFGNALELVARLERKKN